MKNPPEKELDRIDSELKSVFDLESSSDTLKAGVVVARMMLLCTRIVVKTAWQMQGIVRKAPSESQKTFW